MHHFILDDASAFEYNRLDLMSKILDPWTRRYLTQLGIGEGWQCLELGGGNGSNAEWIAAMVGPTGSVAAIDIKPVLLDLVPAQNLTVQQMDVRTGELRANFYDLVTCRALLHQIAGTRPRCSRRWPPPSSRADGFWFKSLTSTSRLPRSRRCGRAPGRA